MVDVKPDQIEVWKISLTMKQEVEKLLALF